MSYTKGLPAAASRHPVMRKGALLGAYALCYLILGDVTLDLLFGGADEAFFWPAIGLAAGVMSVTDGRTRQAVSITTFVVSAGASLFSSVDWRLSFGAAVAHTAAPLAFAFVIERLRSTITRFGNHWQLVAFAGAAALAGLAGGIIGAASERAVGASGSEMLTVLWRTAAADMVGIVLLAGAVAIGTRRVMDGDLQLVSAGWQSRSIPVAATVVVTIAVFALPVFDDFSAVGFIVLPLMVWTATVTGQRVVSVVSMVVGLSAIALTAGGSGPFITGSASTSVLSVQAFVLVTHLTAMALAIESESRRIAVAEFEGILNSTNDAVLVADSDGVIRSANEGAAKMFGQSIPSLVGSSVASHFVGRVPRRGGADVLSQDGTVSVDVLSRDVQRTNQWFRTYVLRDLTQVRATQDALTRAFEIIDAAPELVAWFDVDGVMQFMNDAGRELLDLGDAEAFEFTHESLAPDGSTWLASAVEYASEHGDWHSEAEIARPDGSTVPVDLTVLAHRGLDGALSHTSILARDLSERIELDRLKDEFVSNITHELRTPLTAITGYVELFAEGAFGELGPDAKDAIDAMSNTSANLLELVNDLLTLWRSEKQTSDEWRRFDITESVRNVVESLRHQASRKGVALTVSGDAIDVVGNNHHVERAIMNLVSNAVKFTGAGGSVTVVSERSDGRVRVSVADTGIGIAADEQEAVFDRFFRAGSATSASIPGTGLGLPIVREIAVAHGGDVKLQSVLGHGTFVLFEIPTAPAESLERLAAVEVAAQ
ncbi:MAG: ATP-binding protein [Acidimicrobiia bacterium]|nr:ATP-binding protein [Acidimicrobiia bacterium]